MRLVVDEVERLILASRSPYASGKARREGTMVRRRLARRRVMALGLGGAASLGTNILTGRHEAMADTTPETTVYVSNAGSKDVYVLAMNRATGALDLIEKVPVPGADKPSPASLPMALSPDKKVLYAQLRSEPYPVSAFAIERPSGRLKHLGATALIDQMAYLNVDRTGRFLLCASYVGAKLAIYPIEAPGTVGTEATQILDTKPKAHCVVIDSGNKHVYLPVLGGDIVMEFNFDPATGTVTPDGPGQIVTKPNAGPRHFIIHPNKRWGYLITETTATIGAYAIAGDGTLSEMQFVDTGDYNGKDSAAASDIHVTPDGKFLYGAVRTTSTLHGFKIDPDTGTLTPIGKYPTEKTPRGFAIDPRGKFLLSVGMDSASMTVYAIDADSGALNPLKQYPMGTQPNWIEIVDLQ
jgi:6-phosphogluconolactonase